MWLEIIVWYVVSKEKNEKLYLPFCLITPVVCSAIIEMNNIWRKLIIIDVHINNKFFLEVI